MTIIGCAQIMLDHENMDNNVEKIKQYIVKAKASESDIVCFPEFCITGAKHAVDWSQRDTILDDISGACKGQSIWAIVGARYDPQDLYNETYLIDRKGNVVHTHQKTRTSMYEGTKINKGTNLPKAIETDFGKIGMVTCYEIESSDIIKKLAQEDVNIIFCSSYWYAAEQKNPLVYPAYFGHPQSKSAEHGVVIAMCDAFNVDENHSDKKVYEGTRAMSQVFTPYGNNSDIAKFEQLISKEIDFSEIEASKLYNQRFK